MKRVLHDTESGLLLLKTETREERSEKLTEYQALDCKRA